MMLPYDISLLGRVWRAAFVLPYFFKEMSCAISARDAAPYAIRQARRYLRDAII